MTDLIPTLLIIITCLGLPAQTAAAGETRHDKAFWLRVVENRYAVPEGASVPALVRELSELLGSTDPVLRDDVAYSTLTNWIYRQRIVSVDDRRALKATWSANLRKGIGTRDTDAVFLRSFSALALGVLAILDNEAPYLTQVEFDEILTAGIDYLRDERDTRGFDATKGWMHSAAHTGDLLKFLARNRLLRPTQQALILSAISQKVTSTDTVLTHGEDERLARAILSIAARPDFDEAAFRTWASSLTPPRATAAPTPQSIAGAQNRKHLVVSLYAVLSTDTRDLPSLTTARAIVLAALKTMM